jgi:stage II sporulation protein M
MCLSIGFIGGFTLAGFSKAEDVSRNIQNFMSGLSLDAIDYFQVFVKSLFFNLRLWLLIFILGFMYRLRFLSGVAQIIKGFCLGFSLGYMTLYFGGRGFLVSIVSIIPQTIIFIPALVIFNVCALNVASKLHSLKVKNQDESITKKKWTWRAIMFGIAFFVSSLVDGFIVPVFINLVAKLF